MNKNSSYTKLAGHSKNSNNYIIAMKDSSYTKLASHSKNSNNYIIAMIHRLCSLLGYWASVSPVVSWSARERDPCSLAASYTSVEPSQSGSWQWAWQWVCRWAWQWAWQERQA